MGSFLQALLGPGKSIFDGIGDLISKFKLSPEEQVQAQQAMLTLERDYQMKCMDVDLQIAQAQAAVVGDEVKSESVLARNWRPILMLTFTYIIAHNYVIAPMFSIHSLTLPPDMWDLLKLGMGGYIIGRSAEKLAPHAVDILKKPAAPETPQQ